MNILRQFIREWMMTTTPTSSWSSMPPILGKIETDPWDIEDEENPHWPAKNTGAGDSDKHCDLGTDIEDEFESFHDEEPVDSSTYWDLGYYSNPVIQRDR